MRILKFEGDTMRDAIAKVKSELGDQAVIISTRSVRRGLLGTSVEISAAVETDDPEPRPGLSGPPSQGPSPHRAEQDLERLIGPLRTELRSLRALVRASGDNRNTTELRGELAALRRLVEELRTPPPAGPSAGLHAAVLAPDAPLTAPSTASIVMVVGPTGAGKTTTIAKLAARASLIEGRRVRLITLDNYRVGGVDQIRTFAELIGVPLHVAENLAAARSMLDSDDELTLIDTAGRSPRDLSSIEQLGEHLAGLPPIETHLVIPAATPAAVLDDLLRRYRPVSPARLLFTKLDEVDQAPELAAAPARTQLPITWVTTGQAVPEDLEEPTPARIVEMASAGLASRPTRTRTRAA